MDEKMSAGLAIGIFSNIEDEKHTDKEKAIAIYEVMNRPNSVKEVKKEAMIKVIWWLWNRQYRIRKTGGKSYDKMP